MFCVLFVFLCSFHFLFLVFVVAFWCFPTLFVLGCVRFFFRKKVVLLLILVVVCLFVFFFSKKSFQVLGCKLSVFSCKKKLVGYITNTSPCTLFFMLEGLELETYNLQLTTTYDLLIMIRRGVMFQSFISVSEFQGLQRAPSQASHHGSLMWFLCVFHSTTQKEEGAGSNHPRSENSTIPKQERKRAPPKAVRRSCSIQGRKAAPRPQKEEGKAPSPVREKRGKATPAQKKGGAQLAFGGVAFLCSLKCVASHHPSLCGWCYFPTSFSCVALLCSSLFQGSVAFPFSLRWHCFPHPPFMFVSIVS